MSFLTLVALGGWSYVAELPVLAYAAGEIEPVGKLRNVEHVDGGIVEQINVREGDSVFRGQTLVTLSGQEGQDELKVLITRKIETIKNVQRRQRLLKYMGTDPWAQFSAPDVYVELSQAGLREYAAALERLQNAVGAANTRRTSAQRIFDSAQKQLDRQHELYDRQTRLVELGLAPEVSLIALARDLEAFQSATLQADAAIIAATLDEKAANLALNEFFTSTRAQLLDEINAEEDRLRQIDQLIQALENSLERRIVTSPVDGVIQSLEVASIGEVVEAGGRVAQVLPADDEKIAVVHLKPADIGHVEVGDPVKIQFTTFQGGQYENLTGSVMQISATAATNERDETFFLVQIALEEQFVGQGDDQSDVLAGMEVNVSIVTDTRSVLQYVLDPIMKPFQEAFYER